MDINQDAPAIASAIHIDHVQPDEVDTLLSLFIDLFHDREPLTRCIGLSRERMQEFARSTYAAEETSARSQRYCWLARAGTAGNEAVGFIVCDDPAAEGSEPALPDTD